MPGAGLQSACRDHPHIQDAGILLAALEDGEMKPNDGKTINEDDEFGGSAEVIDGALVCLRPGAVLDAEEKAVLAEWIRFCRKRAAEKRIRHRRKHGRN